MADRERGNRLGAYWKEHPEGAEQGIARDSDALGSARPSRYGLSSPANFPPARSVRSPGGLRTEDHPALYDSPSSARGSPPDTYSAASARKSPHETHSPSSGRRSPPDMHSPSSARKSSPHTYSHSSAHGSSPDTYSSLDTRSSPRKTGHPAHDVKPRTSEPRHGEGTPDPAELERLYRIATGRKDPAFADALREGPWTESVLRRRGFLLFLAECAVYAGCFWYLLDPLTVLTARLSATLSGVATAAGVSLAGTAACGLFYPLFRERRLLAAAWGWLAAAASILFLLVQLLLWGEAQAQWTAIRFWGFFFLGPVTANGILSYALLYAHWRRSIPRPRRKPEKRETDEETVGEEEEPDSRPGRGTAKAGRNSRTDRDRQGDTVRERNSRSRDAQDNNGRNPSALDKSGWNRNLSASGSGGWERNSGWERYAQSDRNRWRQTEAERDGRRQAEAVRRKWK